ncbi:FixH family protein [Flavimaricola marinus]|uniref:FixH n=1 Tax=Flavimaricola marinus TaxID=1819565 RepID=A0A238LFU7_9RHOB|nr:FixH family protein [Flavimaricola marinus]SMY08294.1 FixH [Flavimaricola marinus]
MTREIKGWHVFAVFALAFGVIITVNLTLAVNAVRTFPGLEVDNSYVASQSFDEDRAAQVALGWDVSASLDGGTLSLVILQDGQPIAPVIEEAVFGRATSVAQDETPEFTFNGEALQATVLRAGDVASTGSHGNWNLRIKARADDGTLFQQRIIVMIAE